jgi:hypothetical protein
MTYHNMQDLALFSVLTVRRRTRCDWLICRNNHRSQTNRREPRNSRQQPLLVHSRRFHGTLPRTIVRT